MCIWDLLYVNSMLYALKKMENDVYVAFCLIWHPILRTSALYSRLPCLGCINWFGLSWYCPHHRAISWYYFPSHSTIPHIYTLAVLWSTSYIGRYKVLFPWGLDIYHRDLAQWSDNIHALLSCYNSVATNQLRRPYKGCTNYYIILYYHIDIVPIHAHIC